MTWCRGGNRLADLRTTAQNHDRQRKNAQVQGLSALARHTLRARGGWSDEEFWLRPIGNLACGSGAICIVRRGPARADQGRAPTHLRLRRAENDVHLRDWTVWIHISQIAQAVS